MADTGRRVAVATWPPLVPSETPSLGGPVALGLVLGLCSLPVVALWLLQPPGGWEEMVTSAVHRGETPLDPVDAVLLALAPILCASLAGSIVGGLVVRRDPVSAALLAVAASWAVGFVVLSAAADALGIVLEGQFVVTGTMREATGTPVPAVAVHPGLDAARSYVIATAFGLVLAFPVVFLLFRLATGLRERRWWLPGSLCVIGAFAAAHWTTIVSGPLPFACLAAGVVGWVAILRERRGATEGAEASLGDPPWPVAIRIRRPEPRWTVAGAAWSTPRLTPEERFAATVADQPPLPGLEWLEHEPDLPPLARSSVDPSADATWWIVEAGTVGDCAPGTLVWLDTDGTILVIGRPGAGVVKALASAHVSREETARGRVLTLRDAERGVDVRLRAAEPGPHRRGG